MYMYTVAGETQTEVHVLNCTAPSSVSKHPTTVVEELLTQLIQLARGKCLEHNAYKVIISE